MGFMTDGHGQTRTDRQPYSRIRMYGDEASEEFILIRFSRGKQTVTWWRYQKKSKRIRCPPHCVTGFRSGQGEVPHILQSPSLTIRAVTQQLFKATPSDGAKLKHDNMPADQKLMLWKQSSWTVHVWIWCLSGTVVNFKAISILL